MSTTTLKLFQKALWLRLLNARCSKSFIMSGRHLTSTVKDQCQETSSTDNPSTSSQTNKLYKEHVPTAWLEKLFLIAGSAIGGITHPERADLVFTFGETTGWYALQCMRAKMLLDEVGQEILETKPRITSSSLDLPSLRQLPDGLLGREYVRFMDFYGYTPEGRTHVKYVDDPELAYVKQRYREIHDFVHTLLQMPTSIYGEIVVKQFEAVQTGLPLCVLGGLVAPATLSYKDQLEMLRVYTPWALKSGLQSQFLLNVYFERHLEEPLDQLYKKLNITPPPSGSLKNNLVWNKKT